MKNFDDYLKEQLKDENLKSEYDKLNSEFADMQTVIDEQNKDSEKRKTIIELFDGYDGDYKPSEIDWGEPVGNEIF